MAIIAVLSGLSATAFISVRDQQILDNALEETVNFIRDAQIRSVSIAADTGGEIPKGWGVEIVEGESSKLSLHKIMIVGAGVSTVAEEVAFTPIAGIKFEISEASDDFSFLFFTTPFGEPYITKTNCNEGWVTSNKRSEEVIPTCGVLEGAGIEFKVIYKNRTDATIKIDKRGGATVKYD